MDFELSFDTTKCPSMNDMGDYICCNLEDIDQFLRDSDLPREFREFPRMNHFKAFMGFCNNFKFKEGLHMCMVSRKKELEKKRLENRFKSRQAYLKACKSWPKKQKFFFLHVKHPGEEFATMERFHRVRWHPRGCLVVWTKLPSKYKSIKDTASYHRIMLVFSPAREGFFNYQSALAHLIGFKCIRKKGKHCLSCNKIMFSGAGVVAVLLMLFGRHHDFDDTLVQSELFDCNLPLGPNQPPRHFPDERGDIHPTAMDEGSDSDSSGEDDDDEDDDDDGDGAVSSGNEDELEQPSDSDQQDSDNDNEDDMGEDEMDVDEQPEPGRNQTGSSTTRGASNASSFSRPTFNPPFRQPATPSSPSGSEHFATSTPIRGTTTRPSTRRKRPTQDSRSTRQRTDFPSMSSLNLHLTDDPLEDWFPTSPNSRSSRGLESDLETAMELSRRQMGGPTEEMMVPRINNFNGHR